MTCPAWNSYVNCIESCAEAGTNSVFVDGLFTNQLDILEASTNYAATMQHIKDAAIAAGTVTLVLKWYIAGLAPADFPGHYFRVLSVDGLQLTGSNFTSEGYGMYDSHATYFYVYETISIDNESVDLDIDYISIITTRNIGGTITDDQHYVDLRLYSCTGYIYFNEGTDPDPNIQVTGLIPPLTQSGELIFNETA